MGEVGADPTVLDTSAGFTDQCSCRFATLPYSFVGVPTETRTPDPVIMVLAVGIEPTFAITQNSVLHI